MELRVLIGTEVRYDFVFFLLVFFFLGGGKGDGIIPGDSLG